MRQRLAALIALASFGLLVLFIQIPAKPSAADQGQARVSFQIATGATGSSFFAAGQAVAGLLSHPSGVGRCEISMVCGPSGVILSVRTSAGTLDNLRDIDAGRVNSGFARGDAIAAAFKGTGEFRRAGPLTHLRVIAALFPEQMHLVAAMNIHSVADLRGKRVMLGGAQSGNAMTAREILAAWHVPERALRLVAGDSDDAPGLLEAGKLDAYFVMAGAPLDSVTHLLQSGRARLVPLDGASRDRLLAHSPALGPAVIAYPGAAAVDTVAARVFWVVRDNTPDALVYGLTRAFFNPANRPALRESLPAAGGITLARAAENPPAPLHPGAARFYREANSY